MGVDVNRGVHKILDFVLPFCYTTDYPISEIMLHKRMAFVFRNTYLHQTFINCSLTIIFDCNLWNASWFCCILLKFSFTFFYVCSVVSASNFHIWCIWSIHIYSSMPIYQILTAGSKKLPDFVAFSVNFYIKFNICPKRYIFFKLLQFVYQVAILQYLMF